MRERKEVPVLLQEEDGTVNPQKETHAMETGLQRAICEQVIWKNDPVMSFAVGFVGTAIALARQGLPCGADDVSDAYRLLGHHVEGSAVAMLREAHVIRDCFDTISEFGIHGGRRRSRRESANGRKVSTYRLSSIAAAEEFLRRNGVEISRQPELFVIDSAESTGVSQQA